MLQGAKTVLDPVPPLPGSDESWPADGRGKTHHVELLLPGLTDHDKGHGAIRRTGRPQPRMRSMVLGVGPAQGAPARCCGDAVGIWPVFSRLVVWETWCAPACRLGLVRLTPAQKPATHAPRVCERAVSSPSCTPHTSCFLLSTMCGTNAPE